MTIYTVTTDSPSAQDVFNVPVGLIRKSSECEPSLVTKEKYQPSIDKTDIVSTATATAASAAGAGLFASILNGRHNGSQLFQGIMAAGAVAGAVKLGIDQTYQAFTHQRVTYVTVHNTSTNRTYNYVNGYNRSGHATVPDLIRPNTTVRMAFHNEGPFSGAVQFTSKDDFLYIGASNPSIGSNKLRVECVVHDRMYDIYQYWDEMNTWSTRVDCGRGVMLTECVYDNPSQCTLTIRQLHDKGVEGKDWEWVEDNRSDF